MSRNSLKVMVLGRGGREHAIAWALSKSESVSHVFCVPGNGGTAKGNPKIGNLAHGINRNDFEGLVELARYLVIDLVVAGSEDILVNGIADVFCEAGITFFGPSNAAARLEGSKSFAKDFMTRHSIPTARYINCNTVDAAKNALSGFEGSIVVKASGLAAGKGVLMPENKQEAVQAIETIMIRKVFGESGKEVVIEDYLKGDEISITFITDGKTFRTFPIGQDAQRILNGNKGANTGGMGVYAPTSLVNIEQAKEIEDRIIKPTIKGCQEEGFPILGFVCIGLIMSENGPMLLEYNMRFGDPEAQTLLPMLSDKSDLVQIILSCVRQELASTYIEFRPQFAVSVVIAAENYPQDPCVGDKIEIGSGDTEPLIFHAGTKWENGQLVTDGGRIFACTCVADSLQQAVLGAYQTVHRIRFRGMYFRTDIGQMNVKLVIQQG